MTKFNLKPDSEQLEEARKQIKIGLERASDVLPKEEDLDVDISWTSEDFAKEKMGGVKGMAHSANRIELEFNSEVSGWRDNLIGTSIHEYTHSWFYEQIGCMVQKEWRYILDEALTQNMTEKLAPEAEEPWRTKHSVEDIGEYWPEIKEEELDREDNQWPDPLFINPGEEGYPNWLGYSVAYRIGRKLLESYKPEDFPELEKEDLVKAGDSIFGDEK